MFEDIICDEYTICHGDLTFNNCLWNASNQTLLVFDPGVKFGNTLLFGDPTYDWAKLYYSVVDKYDVTNDNGYVVVHGDDVILHPSPDYSLMGTFWDVCSVSKKQIYARLTTIWFSLVGYLQNDIDTMDFAFYKGCLAYERYIAS